MANPVISSLAAYKTGGISSLAQDGHRIEANLGEYRLCGEQQHAAPISEQFQYTDLPARKEEANYQQGGYTGWLKIYKQVMSQETGHVSIQHTRSHGYQ